MKAITYKDYFSEVAKRKAQKIDTTFRRVCGEMELTELYTLCKIGYECPINGVINKE